MYVTQTDLDPHADADVQAVERHADITTSAASLRDQLYEENQGKAIKAIGVTLVGLYLVYRFLFKR